MEHASVAKKYPRLVALQHKIAKEEAPDLLRLIRLKKNSYKEFAALLSAIKNCVKQLEKDLVEARIFISPTHEPPIPKFSSGRSHKLAAYHTKREYANIVHNLLLQNWNCVCTVRHTTTLFCLNSEISSCSHKDSQCDCEQARFDLLFCAAAENDERTFGDKTWQQGQIGVMNNQ